MSTDSNSEAELNHDLHQAAADRDFQAYGKEAYDSLREGWFDQLRVDDVMDAIFDYSKLKGEPLDGNRELIQAIVYGEEEAVGRSVINAVNHMFESYIESVEGQEDMAQTISELVSAEGEE